ncbi:hypothetical protein CYMTET_18817 [Cymbomonas tetramitiformis]|uniref:Uncharacterized protein n=1 Tax=Cymbomonas tetramitiformis TaxID=36881 RepID=A0AAE0G7I3_9CHLO|nr:hypothetical protein CYMTET_18817 [Cymbomonas tetramitiformis]
MRTDTSGEVCYDFYQRGSHDHGNFMGKCFSHYVRNLIDEDIRRRLPPKRIFKNLCTTATVEGFPPPKYENLRKYIYNNRANILDSHAIKTYGDYMTVCQSDDLLAVSSTDLTVAGTLCMFEGQVLTGAGGFLPVDYYVDNSENTLPPISSQASQTLEELGEWHKARWNQDAYVYEQILQGYFISIRLACDSAQFFVQCLEFLLVSQGWSTHAKRFYKGKLNLRNLYTNYHALVHDYTVAQKRKRFCVIYTTWGKLSALSKSLHRSRDDTRLQD